MKTLRAILLITLVSYHVKAQLSDSFLSFDGSNDVVTIPGNFSYQLGTDNFTIEAWIRNTDFTGTNSFQNIFGTSQPNYNCSPPCSNGFGLELHDGHPALYMDVNYIGSGSGVFAYAEADTIDLRDGLCHHIAATAQYSAGVDTMRIIRVYVDGILKKTTYFFPGMDIVPGFLQFYIGSLSNNSRMKGMVKEVRLWRTQRTQSQIMASLNTVLTSSEPNLIGYWRCSEGTGTLVHDYSITANNGSLGNGTATTQPAWDEICCGAGCVYPSNLHVTNLTSTSAKLNWNLQNCTNGYRIQYRLKGTTAWTTLNAPGTQGMKTISGLAPNSKYQWHIRTKCGLNPLLMSAYSPVQTFTTLLRLGDSPADEELTVSVYPNPFSESAVIELNREGNYEAGIFDMFGRTVLKACFHRKEYKIQRGDLAPGVYCLTLSENRQILYQQKMVIASEVLK